MTQIFGDYCEGEPNSPEFLIIGFSPSSVPLKQRWRNNGLSADFMADYLTTFFLGNEDNPASMRRQAEIKSAVGFVANELLENAMKFTDERSAFPISIQLQLHPSYLMFFTTNSVEPEKIPQFQTYLEELTSCDPEDMYVRQLEKNALEEMSTSSRLGYLTMMSDYMARLGWKFETVQKDPEVVAVTTMVQLPV